MQVHLGYHVPLPGMTQRAPAGRLWAAQDSTSRPLRLPDPPVQSTFANKTDYQTMDNLFGEFGTKLWKVCPRWVIAKVPRTGGSGSLNGRDVEL